MCLISRFHIPSHSVCHRQVFVQYLILFRDFNSLTLRVHRQDRRVNWIYPRQWTSTFWVVIDYGNESRALPTNRRIFPRSTWYCISPLRRSIWDVCNRWLIHTSTKHIAIYVGPHLDRLLQCLVPLSHDLLLAMIQGSYQVANVGTDSFHRLTIRS